MGDVDPAALSNSHNCSFVPGKNFIDIWFFVIGLVEILLNESVQNPDVPFPAHADVVLIGLVQDLAHILAGGLVLVEHDSVVRVDER